MAFDPKEESRKNRQEILGYRVQKEIVYTKFLPYPELVDEESQRLLADLKGFLGRAVMLKDINSGCVFWSCKLIKYIKMFGLKFSKEDHLTFVHMMSELALIPDLEPYLVHKFLNVLILLLNKKNLLSPEELTIPWRPFYDLYIRILGTSQSTIGMYRYFSCLEGSLQTFINVARPYFGQVTQDMLDLWSPKLCPFDANTMHEALTFLALFLPIHRSAQSVSCGHELWFDDFMNLWKTCNNASVSWEREIMQLMAKLACNNIGCIDWEPHLPFMFTKIVRSLNLPVCYKQINSILKPSKLETTSIAVWIVSVLGGNGSGQKYLNQMMKSVESYLHPANTGRWILRLKELLRKLPYYFVQRLHTERFKDLTWEAPIPENQKLTEDDITMFVECMKPAMMTAMFSKLELSGNHFSMQHLAILRPELIIPPIIDILYSTLDSLTEPHKYTSAMSCVTAVARPLVEGIEYKEGPTHVIPLLFATLPGIDPNDVRKCFVTFQFITTFANMIPIVDCSAASTYWNDLSNEEQILCEATSQFEDFVLQFLDKCFVFVESSILEITRLERDQDKRSKLENMTESVLSSTCFPLLYQMSFQIFNSALRKLYSFATGCILETTVAGRYIASICRTFARVRPEETLKMFIPHLCENILTLTESNDVLKEEILSNELLYNMLLLAQIVDCRSTAIMQYRALLERVLDRTLHMTSQEGNMYSSRLLNNLMMSISIVYPKEYRSSDEDYDKPISEYLPVRDWGKPGNVNKLKVEWNIPGKDEVAYAQHIVAKYLPAELQLLEKNALSLTREERLCSLKIISAIMGCGSLLPIWDEPVLNLNESRIEFLTNFTVNLQRPSGQVVMPDGSNVRRVIATSIGKLQKTLLESGEGDTKALNTISLIWSGLLLNMFRSKDSFDMHWKAFHMGKKMLENKLSKGKKHLRSMLIERSLLQLEAMELSNIIMPTATHQEIMLNLLVLSTSRYSEVRSVAQSKLFNASKFFPYSYHMFIPKLVQILQDDSEVHHDQLKGALYILLGPSKYPIVARPNWKVLSELWPAIVRSKPSEKLSISKLLVCISQNVHKHFPTITINLQVPDSCGRIAENFWKLSSPSPSLEEPSVEERTSAALDLKAKNAENMEYYLILLNSLVDAINNSNLSWKYQMLAVCFLRDLVHPDTDYPPHIVKNFLQMLNHDFIQIRKVALRCAIFVLKQQKQKFKKQLVDPKLVNKMLGYEVAEEHAWLQYNHKVAPKTAEEWDTPRYVHKSYVGYNGFSKELMVYSPSYEQPPLDREWQDLTPAEQEVDAFFSNPANIDKLISYFCLEENKGKDKFSGYRFLLFKNLFRNFGDKHINMFLPHLEKLVADKQETNQRCAAEMLSGMIRGSKHWPFDKVKNMWDRILPLIQIGLSNMTVETVGDWGVFAATSSENRDPHRQHWLLELLMEDPLRQDASFLDCGRLCALQGALNQEGWRVSQLYYRLLEYLQPHLHHPFQIIRERIGSILVNVFSSDLPTSGSKRTRGPYVNDFIKGILPQLTCLYGLPSTTNHVLRQNVPEPMVISEKITDVSTSMQQITFNCEDENREGAIRLLKTVCKWITNSLMTAQYSALPEFFSLFPLIAIMESYEKDEELKKACKSTLATLAQSLATPEIMPSALIAIEEVSESKSWWARETCLGFLQVFIFHNMAIFASQTKWVQQVNNLVLRLLKDERLEVREKAGQVLSGLLHIGFISDPNQLLNNLKRLASRSKKKSVNENISKLHAGILGLCSFISASPYDVPDTIPEIFLLLGSHLNDPQPIPATIRKTLGDFNRTHHDNWEQHKLSFTEEQLAVLTDLIVPPSYIV